MLEKFKKRKQGFTLLEVITVMIILGVLAAIGMPALWNQMNRQRAQEAINTMNMMRSVMESCGLMNGGDFTNCVWSGAADDGQVPMDMADPSNARFTYTWTDEAGNNTPGDGTYTMTGKKDGDSWIRMTRAADGTISCHAEGIYQGMC